MRASGIYRMCIPKLSSFLFIQVYSAKLCLVQRAEGSDEKLPAGVGMGKESEEGGETVASAPNRTASTTRFSLSRALQGCLGRFQIVVKCLINKVSKSFQNGARMEDDFFYIAWAFVLTR